MGNEKVIVQIIPSICDSRETFAFHDDKRADHCFLWEAPPPGRRSGQREIQTSEEFVVKRSGALGCEQGYILNNFLSVDRGQPLSGGVSSQVDFTKKRLRFLQYWSDFRLKLWPESLAISGLLAFCSSLVILKEEPVKLVTEIPEVPQRETAESELTLRERSWYGGPAVWMDKAGAPAKDHRRRTSGNRSRLHRQNMLY